MIKDIKLDSIDKSKVNPDDEKFIKLIFNKDNRVEIQQLKSKLAKAKTSLNNALNYLHWREDDLIGDDFKGDGKLTAEYKNKVSEIEKSISEIGGGVDESNSKLESDKISK